MADVTKLLDRINANNPHQHLLNTADVSLGVPTPTGVADPNTGIVVTAKPGSGYKGSVTIHYNRSNMTALLTSKGMLSEEPFTLEGVVDIVDGTVEHLIEVNDLVPGTALPDIPVGEIRTLQLQADASSIGWVGQTSIDLLYGLPPNISDLHQLVAIDLAGPGFFNE